MAFDICYWFLWVTLIVRTSLTSYMNIKFSRDLKKANSQFVFIFNESIETLRDTIKSNHQEQVAREKANKLAKFNKEYAEKQLSRIITSFFKD